MPELLRKENVRITAGYVEEDQDPGSRITIGTAEPVSMPCFTSRYVLANVRDISYSVFQRCIIRTKVDCNHEGS